MRGLAGKEIVVVAGAVHVSPIVVVTQAKQDAFETLMQKSCDLLDLSQ